MKLVMYLLAIQLYSLGIQVSEAEDTAKKLSQYYYKGSALEERLTATYNNLPMQLKTALSYFAPLNQIFVEQYISIVITFP